MDRITRDHAIDMLADFLTPVASFLKSQTVQEVMINGPNDVWIEEDGVLRHEPDIEISEIQINAAIEIMARLVGKEASASTQDAIIDARLTGLRVAAALAPIATRGPSICVRKHSHRLIALEEYVDRGSLPGHVYGQICEAIATHQNILISGSTSSGKTTFLNAMIAKIDPRERIVTIEDTQELQVASPNWVSFEANEQNKISIRSLVRLSLRYRPDRIIVGEVRSAEAFDLMQALNTGHDGGFATIHANSPRAALTRLETLVLSTPDIDWPLDAIRYQIAQTFNIVVQLSRIEGRRCVSGVIRLVSYDSQKKEYIYEKVYERV